MQKIRPDMDIGHNIQRLRRRTNMTQGSGCCTVTADGN